MREESRFRQIDGSQRARIRYRDGGEGAVVHLGAVSEVNAADVAVPVGCAGNEVGVEEFQRFSVAGFDGAEGFAGGGEGFLGLRVGFEEVED